MVLVSVVLPLNRIDDYTSLAIESVLASCHVELELIIICDQLPKDQLQPLLGSEPDPRIRVFNSDGKGIAAALNKGIFVATGSYIARMDGDDVCHTDRLRLQVDYLTANPKTSMVGTGVELICPHGTVLGSRIFPRRVSKHSLLKPFSSPVAHPSVMIRSSALANGNVYRELFEGFQAEDFDLWYRVLDVGRIENLSDKLLRYRIHPNQISTVKSREVALSTAAVVLLDLHNSVTSESLNLAKWYGDPERLVSYLAQTETLRNLTLPRRIRAHTYIGYMGAFEILRRMRSRITGTGSGIETGSSVSFMGTRFRLWSWFLLGFVACLHLSNAIRLLARRFLECEQCKAAPISQN